MNYDSRSLDRTGDGELAVSDRNGGDRVLPLPWSSRCEEVAGRGAGAEGQGGRDVESPRSHIPAARKAGETMTRIIRSVREWWLIAFCAVLLLCTLFPVVGIEIYPVIDTQGGNLQNMQTDKGVYLCGDIVRAQMKFQKQRAVTGQVKWAMVDGPDSHIDLFPPRVAAAPVGIYDTWVDVEKIPAICRPGRYHFEGVITYTLLLGTVTYQLKTTCFEVKGK